MTDTPSPERVVEHAPDAPALPEPAEAVAPLFAMSGAEFVALMAFLMALGALAIDAMLPALPVIADDLGAWSVNSQQYVVIAFLMGNAVGSLVTGPLSDRFGRKPVLLGAIIAYILCSGASALAPDFETLLGIRAAHGFITSAFAVVSISVIRDRFSGDRMARTMSTIFLVFMIVPVIAPAFGQMILYVAKWEWIFWALMAQALIMGIWTWRRLPETLAGDQRRAINPAALLVTWRAVTMNRIGAGYSIASGLVSGGLFGFLGASQQIFADVFDAQEIFPYAFAAVAVVMALANFFNSRIVERFGARRVSQTALICYIFLGLLQVLAALSGAETMVIFLVLIALNMGMVGFTGANFGAIAMQPFGTMAGAASAFQSFVRMALGAGLGAFIGQQFDGTTVPLAIGFLGCGIAAILLILFAERGRLFTRPNAPKRASAGE